MSIKLGSNIASVQAQSRLGEATSSLTKIYQRLSSGQRINSAADDAAGLAIAEELSANTRVFTQAIRNGNDGISLYNIADSALSTLSDIVTRISELAAQSANGSFSVTQRKAIDSEAQALAKEFNRIRTSTSFNGSKIFDGSLSSGVALQLGYSSGGTLNTSVGGAIGTGTFSSTVTYNGSFSTQAVFGDINGDGFIDEIGSSGSITSIRFGSATGAFSSVTTISSGLSTIYDNAIQDVNGDGILDLIRVGSGSGSRAEIKLGVGDGTFGTAVSYLFDGSNATAVSVGDFNNDGYGDLLVGTSSGIVTRSLGSASGTFGTALTLASVTGSVEEIEVGDLNNDGNLDFAANGGAGPGRVVVGLGTGSGTFTSVTSYAMEGSSTYSLSLGDLNNDGYLDMVTSGGGTNNINIRLGLGDGSFAANTSFSGITSTENSTLGDVNGDGFLDILTASQSSSPSIGIYLGSGNGSFSTVTSYVISGSGSYSISTADFNGDGVIDAGIASGSAFIVAYGATRSGVSPLQSFSLKTKADALQAMAPLQRTQDNLLKQRGVVGANQSRLGFAIGTLTSVNENYKTANGRIRDADVASEAANLVRTQILQQSASAILAQANQSPTLALKLLQNDS